MNGRDDQGKCFYFKGVHTAFNMLCFFAAVLFILLFLFTSVTGPQPPVVALCETLNNGPGVVLHFGSEIIQTQYKCT